MASTFLVKRNRTRPSRIALKGDVGIASASELHAALMELADADVTVNVDCKDATHLDGAICQLLMVAQRSWPGGTDRFNLVNTSAALETHLMRTGATESTMA